MKMLVRNSDNLVIYAQSDLLLDTEAHGDGWRDTNFNTDNATIVDADLPNGWIGAGMTLINGTWAVIDTPRYEAQLKKQFAITLTLYTNAVQSLLDTTAQAKHYDNIISCCSYAGAPNAFQAEGQAAIEWRGNVWATCYTIMAEVQAGTIPAPTIPELLAMLPVMVWL